MLGTTLRDIDKGLSSKRIIVVTAFIAMTVFAFNRLTLNGVAPLDASDKVTFESLKWIVLGGLFAVTSEHFSKAFAIRFPNSQGPDQPPSQDSPWPISEFLSSDDNMLDVKRIIGLVSTLVILTIMCLKMMKLHLLPGIYVAASLELFITEGFTYIVLGVLASVATEKFGSR